MSELLGVVASPLPYFLLVLLVFGFAPGFVLRLLVQLYPRDNPRRRELIAELYSVPRIQRPLWVAEQLEVVLFEGVPARLRNRRKQPPGIRVVLRTDDGEPSHYLEVHPNREVIAAILTLKWYRKKK